MKLSKPLGLVAIMGMLILAPAALASQSNGKSGTPNSEKSEERQGDCSGPPGPRACNDCTPRGCRWRRWCSQAVEKAKGLEPGIGVPGLSRAER